MFWHVNSVDTVLVITSAKEVMLYLAFVCLTVWLSVCLAATVHKTTDQIFVKNLLKKEIAYLFELKKN